MSQAPTFEFSGAEGVRWNEGFGNWWRKDMTLGEIYVFSLAASFGVAGYCLGKARGMAMRRDTGWEDEAMWWRRNASGLREPMDRSHGNDDDDELPNVDLTGGR